MLKFYDWQNSVLQQTRELTKDLRVPAPEGFNFSGESFVKKENGITKGFILGDEKGVRVFTRHIMDVGNQIYKANTMICIGIEHNILFSTNEAEAKDSYFDHYGIKNEHQELFKEITNTGWEPPFTVYNIQFKRYNNLMFLHEFIDILNEENPQELDQAIFGNKKIMMNRLGFSNK